MSTNKGMHPSMEMAMRLEQDPASNKMHEDAAQQLRRNVVEIRELKAMLKEGLKILRAHNNYRASHRDYIQRASKLTQE